MKIFCWIVCLLASVVSALFLVSGLSSAESAPQEASIAAISVAIVVIPYVFTKAIEGIYKSEERFGEQNDEMIGLLKRMIPTDRLSIEDKSKIYDQKD